jgi:prevent-host-death family protein
MQITNIHEAKTHLSRLVERAAAGEEIVIGKAGKPVARLVKYEPPAKPVRRPGSMKGKIKILPGFDEVDKEIEAEFYGGDIEPPARHARPVVVARRK